MRRILFTAAAAGALTLCTAVPALASNGPDPNTQSADNVHFTADYYESTLSAGLVHWVCAGEHIDNTGQVVRDVEECSISGPGTAQYQPGLYQNLGQQPNPNYGTFPGFPGVTNIYWFSDYNGVFATNWSVRVNGSATQVHISATYPADAG
jgi:hypothetical protein